MIIGISTRFETKPGKSLTSTGVLPRRLARSTVSAIVPSLVAMPRMISHSGMTGTGFMKCMPITRSGRLVQAAISVIEMLEVLVARIAGAGAISSSA